MSSADWSILTDSLDAATVSRGVTSGIARPSGGGDFVYGFNSLVLASGAVALACALSGFAPTTKGGSVRGAVQRGLSAGVTNHSPFLFIGLQGTSVNDSGYLLGLSNEEPSRIVLCKGALVNGLPAAAPGSQGVLRRSTATYASGTWLHLRLDMITNPSGDVILTAFASDLGANSVTIPSWQRIGGFVDSVNSAYDFNDDSLGVNSGSPPYTAGRMGFGHAVQDLGRRGFIDHVECFSQNLFSPWLRFLIGFSALTPGESSPTGGLHPMAATCWHSAPTHQDARLGWPAETASGSSKRLTSPGSSPSASEPGCGVPT